MPKIEAQPADIKSLPGQSFLADSSLLTHSVPAKGVSLGRNRCEAVMAPVISELIPLLGVICVFIAICSLEGAS
jgi:hypothetical protein